VGFAYSDENHRAAVRWMSDGFPGQVIVTGINAEAVACSDDGTMVAVNVSQRAWRWSEANGLQELGLPIGAPDWTHVVGMSADGSVLAGWSVNGSSGRYYATKWTDRVPVLLESGLFAYPQGVSADGRVVIGFSADKPCRWSQEGRFRFLAPIPAEDYGHGRAANANGGIIVGLMRREPDPNPRAFIWRRSLGVLPLQEYARSLGADLDGWELIRATDISDDGTVIVGFGTWNGQQRGWVIRGLPSFCRADQNADGTIDFFDYDDFVMAFERGVQTADFNDDMSVDFFDYDDFVAAFEAGC
jgi:uncharacterized membrane protein